VGISGESVIWTKHENFMFSRNFFIDHLSPISLLLLPNPHGGFTLEGRKMLFTSGENRSLVFKEGILNEILEMLVSILV
jgi:hypothetical protein